MLGSSFDLFPSLPCFFNDHLDLLQRYLLEMYFPVAHSPSLLHFPKKVTGAKLHGSSLLGNARPLCSALLRYERLTFILGLGHATELKDVGISKD